MGTCVEVNCCGEPGDVKEKDTRQTVYLNFDSKSTDQLKGAKVGDKVSVTIQGQVKSVSQREDWDDPEEICGSMDLYVDAMKITTPDGNEFSALAEDD